MKYGIFLLQMSYFSLWHVHDNYVDLLRYLSLYQFHYIQQIALLLSLA